MKKYFLTYPRYYSGRRMLDPMCRGVLEAVGDKRARRFYEEQALRNDWDAQTLERKIRSKFYEKLTGAPEGELPASAPSEVFKQLYLFDFANGAGETGEGIPRPEELTDRLVARVEKFLLEMGRGFTFVERRRRLVVAGEIYPVDLVLFHRGLRCLVLIKIKAGKFDPDDIGRVNLAVNYVRKTDRYENENDPVGLLLCTDRDETTARYALGGLEQKIFVSRYRMTLPDEEEIARAFAESENDDETGLAAG